MKIRKELSNKNTFENIIYTKTEFVSLTTMPIDSLQGGHTNRNSIVIGGAGSGKTRSYLMPNLLQLNTSYIVTSAHEEELDPFLYLMYQNNYLIIKIDGKDEAAIDASLSYDFKNIGFEKTVVFISISYEKNYANIIIEKILKDLVTAAWNNPLPVPTHFLLDDFQDIEKINDFGLLINQCAGRKIILSLLFQSITQFESIYPKEMSYLLKLFNNILFTGGTFCKCETEYMKSNWFYSVPMEQIHLPNECCLFKFASQLIFYSAKYNLEKHPNYKELQQVE